MSRFKDWKIKLLLLFFFLWGLNPLFQPNLTNSYLILARENPPDFSGEGRPGRQTSGGSRNDCPPGDLTALIPLNNSGTTISEHPILWLYISYPSQETLKGEFVLQDEQRNDISRVPFSLPQQSGLISLTFPTSFELEKWYLWYVNLYCNPQKNPVYVQGWIQRIAVTEDVKRELAANELRQDIVFMNYHIWYDALAYLANLRLNNPQDKNLEEAWITLLSAKGVNLEKYSQHPISGSVIFIEE